MTIPVSEENIKQQIEAEKAEIEAIEARLSGFRTSFQKDARELRKQLSDQHETLGRIIRYAIKLEKQLESLRENVDHMNNLHKRSIH